MRRQSGAVQLELWVPIRTTLQGTKVTPQEIKRLLAQTLDDCRMSRGERRALADVLDELDPSDRLLAVYRSVAFDLAREALSNGEAHSVLDWLEEAVKLFQSESDVNQQHRTAESLFSPDDDCPGRIAGLLARASQSVDICVFTITDNRISSEILATQRRGVPVRIISDDDKANDLGSDVDRLAEAGVPVRVDRTQSHTKTRRTPRKPKLSVEIRVADLLPVASFRDTGTLSCRDHIWRSWRFCPLFWTDAYATVPRWLLSMNSSHAPRYHRELVVF